MHFHDVEVLPRWRRGFEAFLGRWLPDEPSGSHRVRVWLFRVLAVTDIILAVYYFHFRYTDSINFNALWFALPLLLAETYSFIDTLLFVVMMWKPRFRTSPPPLEDVTVDVFITTYSEPVELVRETAEAALRIRYPHTTYVLDDGNRSELRAICAQIGCGYITRGEEWKNRPRHAKAGNVNNALTYTSGEFVLILDADQIADPEILHRTLGYFADPQIAFVQTPQYFYNIPEGDPFGSQAPLFYGPIQQGKDGWNAAFFCGSNAVLRREALFQLGLITYINETERQVKNALSHLPLNNSERQMSRLYRKSAETIANAAENAVIELRRNQPLTLVLERFNSMVKQVQRELVTEDLRTISTDLAAVEGLSAAGAGDLQTIRAGLAERPSDDLIDAIAPDLDMLGLSPDVMRVLRMDTGEALDVQPLVTFSITEDMATAMRLHSIGWKSVFHSEILAKGLAPEDLGSALGQRLRWGAGTIQVLMQENPLTKAGLSFGQRLQYFTTMYSYFSGFFSVVYLAAPIIYLLTGIAPVVSYAGDFLWRIIPYLLINKLMFVLVSWGVNVKRGEQYSLALFPLWIRAVITVFSGDKLTFNVTPKSRQSGVFLNLVTPQIAVVVLLVLSSLYALVGLMLGWRHDTVGVIINIFWSLYNIWMLSVIIGAAVYRPKPEPTLREAVA
jgi:cellulose synthase (UDP-forming)